MEIAHHTRAELPKGRAFSGQPPRFECSPCCAQPFGRLCCRKSAVSHTPSPLQSVGDDRSPRQIRSAAIAASLDYLDVIRKADSLRRSPLTGLGYPPNRYRRTASRRSLTCGRHVPCPSSMPMIAFVRLLLTNWRAQPLQPGIAPMQLRTMSGCRQRNWWLAPALLQRGRSGRCRQSFAPMTRQYKAQTRA